MFSLSQRVKDKTRVMAHSRRRKENDTFTDIAEALPIQENAKDLDKASILRVAIHFLKLREMVGEKEQQGGEEEGEEGEETEHGEQEETLTEELLQPKVELTEDECTLGEFCVDAHP